MTNDKSTALSSRAGKGLSKTPSLQHHSQGRAPQVDLSIHHPEGAQSVVDTGLPALE